MFHAMEGMMSAEAAAFHRAAEEGDGETIAGLPPSPSLLLHCHPFTHIFTRARGPLPVPVALGFVVLVHHP